MSFGLLRDWNSAEKPCEKMHILELCLSFRSTMYGFVVADKFSLEAVASIADCFTSKAHIRFLNQIVRDLLYPIHHLYMSTNPIFSGDFEEACKAAGIEHTAGPTAHNSARTPECGRKLSRCRAEVHLCICGYEVRSASLRAASAGVLALAALIDHATRFIDNDLSKRLSAQRFPVELVNLELASLL